MPTPPDPHKDSSQRLRALSAAPPPCVLVIDDEEGVRTALILVLEEEGYRTLQARDGAEGLDQLRSVRGPLVVVVDWMMPRLNGIALLQVVAADPVLARQHAYLITSAAFPAGLQHVAALPPALQVDVLLQPINLQVFLTKIEQAVTRLCQAHASRVAQGAHA